MKWMNEMTTETKIESLSGKFAETYLLEHVLFEKDQYETKRLATRIPSIKERIFKLQVQYFQLDYIKRKEIRDVILRSFVASSWAGELYDVDGVGNLAGIDCVDWMLKYMAETTRVNYTISHSAFHTDSIPHTVVCPSNTGIAFLNIIHKKLAK